MLAAPADPRNRMDLRQLPVSGSRWATSQTYPPGSAKVHGQQEGTVDRIEDMAEVSVFRPGGVSYLRIAAPDRACSALYYRDVFGWQTDESAGRFQDATGHMIGHFMADLPVAGEAGVVPYVYVQDLDATLVRAEQAGGEDTVPPYPEGELWVAMTRDPAGNAIGVWQRGPRHEAPET